MFQKKSIRPRAIHCADFGNTESQSTRSLGPKTQSLFSLCLRVSVFQKRVSDRALSIARTLETQSHRVHGASVLKPKASSLCASVPPCFKKEHRTGSSPSYPNYACATALRRRFQAATPAPPIAKIASEVGSGTGLAPAAIAVFGVDS